MSVDNGWTKPKTKTPAEQAWDEAQASAREVRFWLDRSNRTEFHPTPPYEHVERICRFIEDIGDE